MYYKIDNYNDYLMHHGVKGQIHGIRNGPPYPLNQAFAKTRAAYKKHQERVAAKKRKAILNDPEKLYKRRADFTEEEIRSATSKAQAVEELKKQIPKKEKKRRDKPLDFGKLSMVDTPEKFIKNQKYLTPDERRKAMDFLRDRDQASKYKSDERQREMNGAKDVSNLLGNISSILGSSFGIIDTLMSRNPNRMTLKERHNKWVYEQCKDDESLLKFIITGRYDNKKDKRDKNQNNNNNNQNGNNNQGNRHTQSSAHTSSPVRSIANTKVRDIDGSYASQILENMGIITWQSKR